MSLLNVVIFSAVNSSGPSVDDIHDDAIVPAAAAISDFNSISAFVGILCWRSCCRFIPDVACIPAVVSSHDIAVILAVACCLCYCCCLRHCCCLHPNCDRHY